MKPDAYKRNIGARLTWRDICSSGAFHQRWTGNEHPHAGEAD
jgi:hypothetical protein